MNESIAHNPYHATPEQKEGIRGNIERDLIHSNTVPFAVHHDHHSLYLRLRWPSAETQREDMGKRRGNTHKMNRGPRSTLRIESQSISGHPFLCKDVRPIRWGENGRSLLSIRSAPKCAETHGVSGQMLAQVEDCPIAAYGSSPDRANDRCPCNAHTLDGASPHWTGVGGQH